jgi:hypothetical protein
MYPNSLDAERILLKSPRMASPAQIARAMVVGVLFALIFVWILPGRPAGAAPASISANLQLG